jgi:hypothetical protein
MFELEIKGTNERVSRAPDPEGTPLEVARELIVATLGFEDADLPDSTPVVLYKTTTQRQTRRRTVTTEVARFTLGDLRKNQEGR